MQQSKSIAVPLNRKMRKSATIQPAPRAPDEAEDLVDFVLKRNARPTVAAPTHRYRIGERLAMNGGGRSVARAGAFCKVVATLPFEGHGSLLYRVRSETEQFERVVAEIDLSRKAEFTT